MLVYVLNSPPISKSSCAQKSTARTNVVRSRQIRRSRGRGAPVKSYRFKASTGPIVRRILIMARYAWALPATFAGLLLSLIAIAFGARVRIVEGAVEVAGGRIDRCISLLPRYCRFRAITFGHVIIGVDHETLNHLRLHEHVHVRQYERWGVFFFPLYLGSSLLQIVQLHTIKPLQSKLLF